MGNKGKAKAGVRNNLNLGLSSFLGKGIDPSQVLVSILSIAYRDKYLFWFIHHKLAGAKNECYEEEIWRNSEMIRR